jgi:hypothetical protein
LVAQTPENILLIINTNNSRSHHLFIAVNS